MSGPGASPLHRHRPFVLLWSGQSASILGDRVTGLALPWLLLLQTHSPGLVGLILAARYLPLLALGLPSGLLADRLSRRSLMIAMDGLRLVALGAVVTVAVLGRTVPLWLLVLVVLALGTGQTLFQVAYRAWLPDLVGEAVLVRANAGLEASDAAATLAGPTLAGGLIQLIGPTMALGADALSYLVSAITLWLADREPAAQPRRSTSMGTAWQEMLAGFGHILASAPQLVLRGISTPLALSSGVIELLLATLSQLALHLSALQAGMIFGAAGVGGLGASTLAPWLFRHDWQRGLAAALLLAATASAILAGAGHLGPKFGFTAAVFANLLLDGAVSLAYILVPTATALITPRELRGRVNAASQMYSSAVRGASLLLLGSLAGAIGVSLPFLLLAAAFLLAAAAVLAGDRVLPGELAASQ